MKDRFVVIVRENAKRLSHLSKADEENEQNEQKAHISIPLAFSI